MERGAPTLVLMLLVVVSHSSWAQVGVVSYNGYGYGGGQFIDHFVQTHPPEHHPSVLHQPQPRPDIPPRRSTRCAPSPHDNSVWDCEGPSPILYRKYTLWLKTPTFSPKPITINVPNYKLSDWLEAGYKGNVTGDKQLVTVVLKKPEFTAQAIAEKGPKVITGGVDVDLDYEKPAPFPDWVHFGGNSPQEIRYVDPGIIKEPPQPGYNTIVLEGAQQQRFAAARPQFKRELTYPPPEESRFVQQQQRTMVAPLRSMWYPISGSGGRRMDP